MNPHDELLAWASERGSGTRRQFDDACRTLGIEALAVERTLGTLGHVEFAADQWACTPTTLSLLPGVPERLLLTGHRPYALLERLRLVADHAGLDVLVEQDGVPQPDGPETILITGDARDAGEFAARAGIRFCARPWRQIAELLSPAVLEEVAQPASPDLRFPHCMLDQGTLFENWADFAADGTPGLWVFREWGGRPVRYLRTWDAWWRFDDPGWAAYLTSPPPQDPWCRYEPANRLFVVNAAAGLPRLAARALSLCSGRHPVRTHLTDLIAEDHYVGVDRITASTVLDRVQPRSGS